MKYQTKDTEYREAVIQDFGGVDRASALCGGSTSFELRNFRRMKDGSLKRRGGLVPWARFEQDIRGAISILRNGERETYVVAGQTVYVCSEPSAEAGAAIPIGQLSGTSGQVSFLEYDGQLILLDGEQFFSLTKTGMFAMEGYIPLYGDNWEETAIEGRLVNERPNLLSRRLRIKVRMQKDGYYIYLAPLHPVSVDALVINGEIYRKTVRLNTYENRVETGESIPMGAQVEVYLTMPEDFAPLQSDLKCARRACSLGRAEDARILFYDLPGKSEVRISRAIPKAEQQTVRAVMPNTCMIYVTPEDEISIGDGIHAVMGGCRHFDRSLIFTAKGSWMADGQVNDDGFLHLIPVNSTMGCSHSGSVAVVGNRPFTVFSSGLLCWNSDTDERNECNAEVVSDAVYPLWEEKFESRMALWANTKQNEIWCYIPGTDGRVWVYQIEHGSWTSFVGFIPDLVIDLEGAPGIIMGRMLYQMKEDAWEDTIVTEELGESESRAIVAEYQSRFLDFGRADRAKRLGRASFTGIVPKQGVTMVLQRVDGHQQRLYFAGNDEQICQAEGRVNIGRFRFVRVGVTCDAPGLLHLYRVCLKMRANE